jgi:Flp pilus assembly protein TadG
MCAWRSRTNRGQRFRGRRGAAAVEFAMTVPIVFMLLFAALELGRMNMIRQTANNAAYEAMRTCVVPGATNAEGVAAAQKLLASIGVTGYTITVTPATITDTTPSVTATVAVPYSTNMWVTPLYSNNRSASVTCTMTRDWVVSTRQTAP